LEIDAYIEGKKKVRKEESFPYKIRITFSTFNLKLAQTVGTFSFLAKWLDFQLKTHPKLDVDLVCSILPLIFMHFFRFT